jgi:hypothetical protein
MFAISVATCPSFRNGRLCQTPGAETLIIATHHSRPNRQRGNAVTYYRVDFVAAKLISRPAKRFISEEKAKQHAMRVLGMANDTGLLSEVSIVPVSKDGVRI